MNRTTVLFYPLSHSEQLVNLQELATAISKLPQSAVTKLQTPLDDRVPEEGILVCLDTSYSMSYSWRSADTKTKSTTASTTNNNDVEASKKDKNFLDTLESEEKAKDNTHALSNSIRRFHPQKKKKVKFFQNTQIKQTQRLHPNLRLYRDIVRQILLSSQKLKQKPMSATVAAEQVLYEIRKCECIKQGQKEYRQMIEKYSGQFTELLLNERNADKEEEQKYEVKKKKEFNPEKYRCALTNEIMTNPVRFIDGLYYEREVIEEWLKQRQTSPVYGYKLRAIEIEDARKLKTEIKQWENQKKRPELEEHDEDEEEEEEEEEESDSINYDNNRNKKVDTRIDVKTFDGKTVGVMCSLNNTVEYVHDIVRMKTSRSKSKLHSLVFGTTVLQPKKRLCDYSIKTGIYIFFFFLNLKKKKEDCLLCGKINNNNNNKKRFTLFETVKIAEKAKKEDTTVFVIVDIDKDRSFAFHRDTKMEEIGFRIWNGSLQNQTLEESDRPSLTSLRCNVKDVGDNVKAGVACRLSDPLFSYLKYAKRVQHRFWCCEIALETWGPFSLPVPLLPVSSSSSSSSMPLLSSSSSSSSILTLASSPLSLSSTPHLPSKQMTRFDIVRELFEVFLGRLEDYKFTHRIGLVMYVLSCVSHFALRLSFLSCLSHVNKTISLSCFVNMQLFDALNQACDHLVKWQADFPTSKLRILVLSDGHDIGSSSDPVTVANKLQKNNVLVDAICIGYQSNPSLHGIVKATGGYIFYPQEEGEALNIVEMETTEKDLSTFSSVPADRCTDELYPKGRVNPNLEQPANSLAAAVQSTEKQNPRNEQVQKNTFNQARNSRIKREMIALLREPHPAMDIYPS
ncbi:hypothetical protein RFI_12696, partial [Reticulomyxa filosa]